MDLETKVDDDILIIKPLAKRIDASSSTLFKGLVNDYISQGYTFVILNLGNVEFVDSSGLGVLISILKTISNSKGTLALCKVNSNVMNLLTITRIDSILMIAPDVDAAKNQLKKGLPANNK